MCIHINTNNFSGSGFVHFNEMKRTGAGLQTQPLYLGILNVIYQIAFFAIYKPNINENTKTRHSCQPSVHLYMTKMRAV